MNPNGHNQKFVADLKARAVLLYEQLVSSKKTASVRAHDVAAVLDKGYFGCMAPAALRLMTRFLDETIPVKKQSPFQRGMLVVPIANPNQHNYPLGAPVAFFNPNGLRADGTYGNYLPDVNAGAMRPSEPGTPEFEGYFERLMAATPTYEADILRAHFDLDTAR